MAMLTLTTHIQLVPRSRIRGSICRLPMRLDGVVLTEICLPLFLPGSTFSRRFFHILIDPSDILFEMCCTENLAENVRYT
jgi:hypothetical protein